MDLAVIYAIASSSFAGLCSLIWLLTGGTLLHAVLIYLLGGQLLMFGLIGFALIAARHNSETDCDT